MIYSLKSAEEYYYEETERERERKEKKRKNESIREHSVHNKQPFSFEIDGRHPNNIYIHIHTPFI